MTREEWDKAFHNLMPVISIGLGSLSLAIGVLASLRAEALARQRVSPNGQYLVDVRYPGQWHDIREFVQPDNPDVLAVYYQYGPDYWSLYDFVCRNIEYRRDWGEFWRTPSETLGGYGDCEDTSILLTSLIRAGGAPNCYVALGSLGGYGHAWCEYNGQVLETTYTSARPIPNPEDYCTYCVFNESEVIELWPGAMDEVFKLGRDEKLKREVLIGRSQ